MISSIMIIFLITCGFAAIFSFGQLKNVSAYGKNTSLKDVDASFITERYGLWNNGSSASIVGDVNGDGYDDIVIAKEYILDDSNSVVSPTLEKIYLFFGKESGLNNDINVKNADASFYRYSTDSYNLVVSGGGDVNKDNYDDFLIGTPDDYPGKVYLIFGKSTGWEKDFNLSNASASFIGEDGPGTLGESITNAGDVNGDGYDDILIGSPLHPSKGWYTGKTYLIFGKSIGWVKNFDLTYADASFLGESGWDDSGEAIACGGDVNGDGYDDIVIGAPGGGGWNAGKTYLFLGKKSGWAVNTNLTDADASFIGENKYDNSGSALSNSGDVNNDGLDDILIGAPETYRASNEGGHTYLIFGKSKGWQKNMSLSNADASFVGENRDDNSGWSISIEGDVDGDDFDDIIIGAPEKDTFYDDNGKTYVVLGKSSGWSLNSSLANADVSFIGEGELNRSGTKVSSSGDVNGDGIDDILISNIGNSTYWQPWTSDVVGETHLIFYDKNTKPTSISNITLYSDSNYYFESTEADIGQTVYIELIGTDGDPNNSNIAEVHVKSSSSDTKGIEVRLRETGLKSGRYRGTFKIMNLSHESHSWIGATNGEVITVSSLRDSNVFDALTVEVKDFKIVPVNDKIEIIEDMYFEQKYDYIGGYEPVTWSYESNASWLNWDSNNHSIYGIPTDGDVGEYWVNIKAFDNSGDSDKQNFTLIVHNVNDPPIISEAPVNITVIQLEPQKLDLSSYIYDIDNPKSDLSLQTSSEYVQTEGLELIFDYRYSNLWYENVTINVTDGDLVSNDHYINVEILVVDAWNVEIEDYSPVGNNVSIFTDITIIFNRLMNKTSCENAFSITPIVDGEFYWDYNIMTFIPLAPLDFNKTYVITVTTTATSVEGHPLNAQTSWGFTTEDSTGPDRDNDGYSDDIDDFPDNPLYHFDTDGDSMPDAWEEKYGLKKYDPNDAREDPDNDGIPNKDEFDDGTDPLLSDLKKRHDDDYTIIILIVIMSTLVILFVLIILKPKLSKKK